MGVVDEWGWVWEYGEQDWGKAKIKGGIKDG